MGRCWNPRKNMGLIPYWGKLGEGGGRMRFIRGFRESKPSTRLLTPIRLSVNSLRLFHGTKDPFDAKVVRPFGIADLADGHRRGHRCRT